MSDFIVEALQDAFVHAYMRSKPDTVFGAEEQPFIMNEEIFRFPLQLECNQSRLVRYWNIIWIVGDSVEVRF